MARLSAIRNFGRLAVMGGVAELRMFRFTGYSGVDARFLQQTFSNWISVG
jgi:hypothetical protein